MGHDEKLKMDDNVKFDEEWKKMSRKIQVKFLSLSANSQCR
jgi:hypothetical protein